MRLTVTYAARADEPARTESYEVLAPVAILYARQYGEAVNALALPEGTPMPADHPEKLAYVTWLAAKQAKTLGHPGTDLEFDDWLLTIGELGGVEDDPLAPSGSASVS